MKRILGALTPAINSFEIFWITVASALTLKFADSPLKAGNHAALVLTLTGSTYLKIKSSVAKKFPA
jgi:hypothetical protein